MVSLTFKNKTLTMRNPDMGNQDNLDFTRLSRSTTGGDSIIYRDPNWPAIETFVLNFDHCSSIEMDVLRILLQESLGQFLTYTDHNNDSWSVLIKNPNTPISQAGINSYKVSLELEATKL